MQTDETVPRVVEGFGNDGEDLERSVVTGSDRPPPSPLHDTGSPGPCTYDFAESRVFTPSMAMLSCGSSCRILGGEAATGATAQGPHSDQQHAGGVPPAKRR
jgi:hypothetical protein